MTDTRTIIGMTGGNEEDRMFEGALNSVLHMDKKDYPSYIGGLKVASGRDFTVSSPMDDSIRFGQFQEPDDGMADKAFDSSSDVFKEWSRTDVEKRIGFMETALDSITRQRYRLAAAVTLSSGMTRQRAIREVDILIDSMKRSIKDAGKGKIGKPIGVWAIVSEHNSPLAAPMSYAVASMIAGNTVIMMPSKYTPVPIYMIYDIMKAALLPAGVMDLIVDNRGKETERLLGKEVAGIVASGSGERMEEMMFLQMDDQLMFVNEMKGMNPILVNRPSSMKDVASAVIERAFSYAGQDINATSKVIVMADDQKQFMEHIMKATQSIVIGDPVEKETTVGPVISARTMEEFLEIADDVRDSIIFGGKRVVNDETRAGYYIKPMIVMGLPMDHELNNVDHGIPILSIQIASDMDEAMEMVNGCEFGLSATIYTKDENIAKEFREIAVAENVYVNESMRESVLNADIGEFTR